MTQTAVPDWNDVDALEDVFMDAGDGNAEAMAVIARVLGNASPADLQEWPQDTREYWESALELALEGMALQSLREADVQLLFALMQAGYDTARLRDMAASHARVVFSDYLDPAGLLNALGLHSPDTPVAQIASRWEVFRALAPDVDCWEVTNGLGKILELDDIANEVNIRFARRRSFPLSLALQNLVLIQPGSALAGLLDGSRDFPQKKTDGKLLGDLCGALVSALPVSLETLGSLLVPAVLTDEQWTALTREDTAPSEAADEEAGKPGRRWDESRSVPELADLLGAEKAIPGPPPGLTNVAEVMRAGSERNDQALQFSQVAARLWHLAPGQEWLRKILTDLAGQALAWTQDGLFSSLSDRLPGKATPDWFRATVAANGPEYLADACMQLPIRLWPYVERAVQEETGNGDLLFHTAEREVKTGVVSADVLLWLWKGGDEQHIGLLDTTLVFRTLQKPVHGPYIRARKELHKLLMENAPFQRVLMKQGDPDAVANFVRCVKHMSLLDSGERQSLLVRIVRVFPEARSLVEEKRQNAPRKAIGKITSVRSFKLRHRELEDIIGKRIPANSRAIAHARSYGDLRENAEFKAAKEEQAYLAARRAELEDDLHEIKPTDFGDVAVNETVVPGCSVELRYPDGNIEVYHLLGLWDSVPENNMLSYDTPLGKLLLGSRIGASLTMPSGQEAVVAALHPLSAELREWILGEDVA